MDARYFHQTEHQWLPYPGRIYVANMPVADITTDILILHRAVGHTSTKGLPDKWCVSHGPTGARLCGGTTKEDAMRNAQEALRDLGKIGFELAVKKTISILAKSGQKASGLAAH